MLQSPTHQPGGAQEMTPFALNNIFTETELRKQDKQWIIMCKKSCVSAIFHRLTFQLIVKTLANIKMFWARTG